MASLGQTFDANNVEPAQIMEAIPPGEYVVQIVGSEMKATRSGEGQFLALDLQVIDGPFANRHLWDNLNLINNNTQTVEIAQRTLSAICHAVGKLTVNDSEELHMKPMIAVVGVIPAGPDKKGYVREKPSNKISGYKAMNGTTKPANTGTPPRTAAAPAKPATPPWRRTA